MPRLAVTTREGGTRDVQGAEGVSVMEVIRGAGIDELLALCGGCCSCATCHVHVSADWWPRLAPMGANEGRPARQLLAPRRLLAPVLPDPLHRGAGRPGGDDRGRGVSAMETLSTSRAHGGVQSVHRHRSEATGGEMTFSVHPRRTRRAPACPWCGGSRA